MSNVSADDVAIVGIGMHAFGRHEGVTGMEMGASAVRSACADANVSWEDVQFAFGGSAAAGAPDTMVSQLGLTGLQFINVANGCATGGSALFSAYNTIKAGMRSNSASPSASTSTSAARSASNTKGESALGDWYGGERHGAHHPVLRHEDQPLHARVRHHPVDAGQGVGEGVPQRLEEPDMAWRRKPLYARPRCSESAMLSYPLTQYMFCSPGEGGVALILCRADQAHKYTDRRRCS